MIVNLSSSPSQQKHPQRRPYHLGLFRKICASIVLGEIIQEIQALRFGESHPLILFLDKKNKLVLSSDFDRLYRRIVLSSS